MVFDLFGGHIAVLVDDAVPKVDLKIFGATSDVAQLLMSYVIISCYLSTSCSTIAETPRHISYCLIDKVMCGDVERYPPWLRVVKNRGLPVFLETACHLSHPRDSKSPTITICLIEGPHPLI